MVYFYKNSKEKFMKHMEELNDSHGATQSM